MSYRSGCGSNLIAHRPRARRENLRRHPSPLLTHASSQELSIVVFVASPAATTVIIAIIIVVIVVIPIPLPRSIPGDHTLFHWRAARSLPDRRAGRSEEHTSELQSPV